MSIRGVKRQARRALHGILSVPALYLAPASAPTNPYTVGTPEHDAWTPPPPPYFATPLPVNVRVHTKFEALGDMKGTSFDYAERQEIVPKIVFMRDEVAAPQRGSIVSVEVGEAYRVDNINKPDDITVTAEVVQLSTADAHGLPIPV